LASYATLSIVSALTAACGTYEGTEVYQSSARGPRLMHRMEYDMLLNLWHKQTPEALHGKTAIDRPASVLVALADLYERRYGLQDASRRARACLRFKP